ncbi:MAG: response regulator [Saccharospirillaceae bacterium]|nr:response regulator [Colwellia sp.]NRB77212.1 response regulator [Saccharospirillaceae bacterium]
MKKQLGQLLAGNHKLRRPVFIGLASAFALLWLVVTLTFQVWSGFERSESLFKLAEKIDDQLYKKKEDTGYQMLQLSEAFIEEKEFGYLLNTNQMRQASIDILNYKQSISTRLPINRITLFSPSSKILFSTKDKFKQLELSKQLSIAVKSNTAEQGISVSPDGEITLNAVLPIKYKNSVVGFIQLTKLLSSITNTLADSNKVDIHLITHKSVVQQVDYDDRLKELEEESHWELLDSFILTSPTMSQFDTQELPSILNDKAEDSSQKETYLPEYTGSKDVPKQLAILPVHTLDNKTIALMLVVVDNSSAYSAYELSLLVNNISFTVIALIVFILFWFFLGNIERNIYRAEQQLIKAKNAAEKSRDDAENAKNEAEEAKAEAENSKHQAEQANKIKSEFLAKMSHELRTPLNAIIGITEMMQEDAQEFDDEDYIEPLGRVVRAGKHLLSLINDILDLSKIEAGKMELYPENFELTLFIKDIERIVEPLVNKNANQMVVSIDKKIKNMYADSTRVKQILLNLLSNACKFTDKGKICLLVSPALIAKKPAISFSIIDEGIGMNEEQLAMLFQDFQQVDSSSTRKYEGTGLGLSISLRFAELMGGNITVSSESNKGSIFTVTLPLGTTLDEVEAPVIETLPPVSFDQIKKPYILVVEDDDNMIEMLRHYFSKQGVQIDVALNGTDALTKARLKKPNLITLDINMPGLNGWDTLTIIKSDAELSDIPVVVITSEEERKKGLDLGADEYLIKPINKDDIEAIFSRFVK